MMFYLRLTDLMNINKIDIPTNKYNYPTKKAYSKYTDKFCNKAWSKRNKPTNFKAMALYNSHLSYTK